MGKAKEMLKELGFNLYNQAGGWLTYKYETDYDMVHLHFHLSEQTYHISWERFIDNDTHAYVPMRDRPQNIKHSCYYGFWKRESVFEINCKLHNAIHQQMLELGWV